MPTGTPIPGQPPPCGISDKCRAPRRTTFKILFPVVSVLGMQQLQWMQRACYDRIGEKFQVGAACTA
jgi:hypothetical protein